MMKAKVFLASCLALALASTTALAQSTNVYGYSKDMKGYHTQPSFTNSDWYMAGTVFDNPANYTTSKLHQKQISAMGAPLADYVYDVATMDERVVAFPFYTNNIHVIVALIRDNVTGKDGIKILRTNSSGSAIIGDVVLEANSPESMIPMDAIIYNNYLLISGYTMSALGGILPNFTPLPANNKKAFVLRYDLSTGVNSCFTYDFPTSGSSDFDMAIRMKIIQVSGTDELWVTGSNNIQLPTGGGGMGIMNMVLDISASGVPLLDTPIINKPIGPDNTGVTNPGIGGFGIDIVPNGAGYYIFANAGNILQQPNGDFETRSVMITNTYVDGAFIVPIIGGMGPNDGQQVQTLLGDYSAVNTTMPALNAGEVIVAGYRGGPGCVGSRGTTIDSIGPYLLTTKLSWNPTNGNTSVILNEKTFYSTYGTFNHLNANSYWALGGGLSTYSWGSKFASRRGVSSSINNNIHMAVPRADNVTNKLNLKSIQTDAAGNMIDCNGSFGSCGFTTYTKKVRTYPLGTSAPFIVNTVNNLQSTISVFSPTAYIKCANTYFKTSTQPAGISAPLEATIYPNPAKQSFSIRWNTMLNAEDRIAVTLYDVMGRKVRTLFDGNGDVWYGNTTIDCSDIPSALYMVNIEVNNTKLAPAKLQLQ